MRPLRILHITRDYPPRSSGGLSTAVGGLVSTQARAGIECSVVSFDDYRPRSGDTSQREATQSCTDDGIPIIRVSSPQALPQASEGALRFVADVVHVHDGRLWDFASEIAEALRAPSLYTAHVMQSEQDRLRGTSATESTRAQAKALRECTAIHAPSQAVAMLLRETLDDDARLHVIPLATGAWPSTKRDRLRPRVGPPLLLYVGRFADINGFAEFLAALPPLLTQHPQLQVVAAGGLPGNHRGEQRWRKRWHAIAGEHEARLKMPGWLSQEQLSELYGRATVLIVPSWFETFAQVVLEGMLHGAPLVTTGAGAIAELVDEESALLVEAKSASAIVSGVNQVLSDPAAAQARRDRAYEKAHRDYAWDARIPLFRTLYDQLKC